jgi:hypothetical protein
VNPVAAVYGFWLGIPTQVREPIKRAVVSFVLSIGNITFGLAVAFQVVAQKTNEPMTLPNFLTFVSDAWFAYALGVFIAAFRGKQGYQAAKDPQSAVPTPTPPATVTVTENPHSA